MSKTAETERVSSQLDFSEEPLIVAERLRGAIVVTDGKRFIITDAKGFNGVDITREEFQGAKGERPGTVTGSPYRGTTFVNISTGSEGLVMPQSVTEIVEGELRAITGPGRVAKALGIRRNRKYQLEVEDPHSKILRLQKV